MASGPCGAGPAWPSTLSVIARQYAYGRLECLHDAYVREAWFKRRAAQRRQVGERLAGRREALRHRDLMGVRLRLEPRHEALPPLGLLRPQGLSITVRQEMVVALAPFLPAPNAGSLSKTKTYACYSTTEPALQPLCVLVYCYRVGVTVSVNYSPCGGVIGAESPISRSFAILSCAAAPPLGGKTAPAKN